MASGDSASTLVIQLTSPLPSGTLVPVLEAEQINGAFATIVVKDVPSRNCETSGQEQRTATSLVVLMYVLAIVHIVGALSVFTLTREATSLVRTNRSFRHGRSDLSLLLASLASL